jgi:hypothetical protein
LNRFFWKNSRITRATREQLLKISTYECRMEGFSVGNVTIAGSNWIVLGLLAVYVFPAVVALIRRQPNIMAIILVNLLLGWTGIGWIVALWLAKATDEPVGDGVKAAPDFETTHNALQAFHISKDLHERVSDMAMKTGVPVEEIGCQAITEYLEREQAGAIQK